MCWYSAQRFKFGKSGVHVGLLVQTYTYFVESPMYLYIYIYTFCNSPERLGFSVQDLKLGGPVLRVPCAV